MSLINTDVKILNKILAKYIEKYIKRIIQLDQVGFIPGMHGWFSICAAEASMNGWFNIYKSTNNIYHVNKMQVKNQYGHLNRYRK